MYEECDDGNRLNGDGCSASCDIEDDIEVEIKKKKVVETLKQRTAPISLPLPDILAPTGHAANKDDYIQEVIRAYEASVMRLLQS